MFRAITARTPLVRTIVCAKTFYRAIEGAVVSLEKNCAEGNGSAGYSIAPWDNCEEDQFSMTDRLDALELSFKDIQKNITGLQKKATGLRKDYTVLEKDLEDMRKQAIPVTNICFGAHRINFLDYCVLILIRGTDQLRCSGISFSDWVETQSDKVDKVVSVFVDEQDFFGPREIVAPISVFLLMRKAILTRDKWVHKSCARRMANSIKYMDDHKKDASSLTKSDYYLLFEVVFGITVEECIESIRTRWDLPFHTPKSIPTRSLAEPVLG